MISAFKIMYLKQEIQKGNFEQVKNQIKKLSESDKKELKSYCKHRNAELLTELSTNSTFEMMLNGR